MWLIYYSEDADSAFVQLQLGICHRPDLPEWDKLGTVKRKMKLFMNLVTHKTAFKKLL